MNKKLKDIVSIKSGVFAKSNTNPDVYYIQATDFNSDLEWIDNLNPTLTSSPKLKKHFLRKGDILFASKGKDFFAVVYDEKYQPAVASSTFLVMNVEKETVQPAFLAWYLNHPKTQMLLSSFAKGTAIKSLNISIIGDIEITIPDYAKQITILELFNLQKKEKFLQNKISKLRQNYFNELTYKSIQ